jgi:hypothetical protein
VGFGMVGKSQNAQVLIALFQQGTYFFVISDLSVGHEDPPFSFFIL